MKYIILMLFLFQRSNMSCCRGLLQPPPPANPHQLTPYRYRAGVYIVPFNLMFFPTLIFF